jgi:AraC-type DNA-binding domain-containing proteins
VLKMLYGEVLIAEKGRKAPKDLLEILADIISKRQGITFSEQKEVQRMKKNLVSIFQYIGDSKLNIQFLAKEVLFMNEEYFGRLFVKYHRMRFSNFILVQRIELAKRLLRYDVELKVSNIVELIGFASDGQYFSKVFKKSTGMTPTEYRNKAI